MRAVVYRGEGDIGMEDVPDPQIEQDTDAVIRVTRSAICGTDLHFIRGSFTGMEPGTVLGHEAVGVVEQLGEKVRGFSVGDRVVVCSTISCGACAYCRAGHTAQCDVANPGGKRAGTAFFGSPKAAGGINGLQAERARIPFATNTLVKLPDEIDDDRAILMSDIFPTGWFGADLAGIKPGDTVAVFGCGPVGQFAIASAKLMEAGRVFAIDQKPDRLAIARRQGAEVIDFSAEDPVETLVALTNGIGVDRAIDAVGVDAEGPHGHGGGSQGPNSGPNWRAGDKPGGALAWAVTALAKSGTLAIIGVYPPTMKEFPIGEAMNKNLVLRLGNCNHRAYMPKLIRLVRSGAIDPAELITQEQPLADAIEAYERFDRREDGWLKVELDVAA